MILGNINLRRIYIVKRDCLTAELHGMPVVALDVVKACPLSGNGITDEHFVERVILKNNKYFRIPLPLHLRG